MTLCQSNFAEMQNVIYPSRRPFLLNRNNWWYGPHRQNWILAEMHQKLRIL